VPRIKQLDHGRTQKNAIDWASGPLPGEASLACFTGKTAALVAASPAVSWP
jgi:hypothetical protein